jgi:galactokinase
MEAADDSARHELWTMPRAGLSRAGPGVLHPFLPMADVGSFQEIFGRAPDHTARAPGRVNLIGEHTDYSEGFVLPAAIPRETVVELARAPGRRVRAASMDVGSVAPVSYELGGEEKRRSWIDYLQGVTFVLRAAGHEVGGFDARISSRVPLGAGLSSSASFEVAVLRALRSAFALSLDDVAIARLGQKVETDFVGAPVGIMDQMAASLADRGSALFLDTRTLAFEKVPLPEAADLVVVNSGVTHSHAGGEYRTRRAECESAARALGVPFLRDLGLADLPRIEALPDPVSRRARHVVTENARVVEAVSALRAGDLPRLGQLLKTAHASLRDDFQVSVPAIDTLVEIADATPGVFGARLTGGGFGGSIVVLAERDRAAAAGETIAHKYAAATGRTATVLRLRE